VTDDSTSDLAVSPHGSIDGLITALYESISFSRERRPDWALFRELFEPGARLFKIEGASVVGSTLDAFAQRIDDEIEQGRLVAFEEREIARRTDVFGGIAQVFSTYERSVGEGLPVRGINAIQMFHDGRRWWIASMLWSDESDGQNLPIAYLPRD
jgi:hypothetical protein